MVKLASAIGAIGILGIRISGAAILLTLVLTVCFREDAHSFFRRLRSNLPLIILATVLIGVGFFLFAWAFLNGYGTSIAQAYLLIPFAMLFGGCFLFDERLRPLQWLGCGVAATGVAHELVVHGGLSWVAMVQTLTMTGYFLVHRILHRYGCSPMQLLVAEFWLLFPIAILCVVVESAKIAPFLASIGGVAILVGLWTVTTLAYISYLISNRYLSCAAFGMWSNLEPILIVLASVLLFREPFPRSDLYTYVPMLIGSVLVVF